MTYFAMWNKSKMGHRSFLGKPNEHKIVGELPQGQGYLVASRYATADIKFNLYVSHIAFTRNRFALHLHGIGKPQRLQQYAEEYYGLKSLHIHKNLYRTQSRGRYMFKNTAIFTFPCESDDDMVANEIFIKEHIKPFTFCNSGVIRYRAYKRHTNPRKKIQEGIGKGYRFCIEVDFWDIFA